MWDEGRPATHEDRGGMPFYISAHPHTGRYARVSISIVSNLNYPNPPHVLPLSLYSLLYI